MAHKLVWVEDFKGAEAKYIDRNSGGTPQVIKAGWPAYPEVSSFARVTGLMAYNDGQVFTPTVGNWGVMAMTTNHAGGLGGEGKLQELKMPSGVASTVHDFNPASWAPTSFGGYMRDLQYPKRPDIIWVKHYSTPTSIRMMRTSDGAWIGPSYATGQAGYGGFAVLPGPGGGFPFTTYWTWQYNQGAGLTKMLWEMSVDPVILQDLSNSIFLPMVPGRFHNPYGVAVDYLKRIYVVDSWNERVQVFDQNFNMLGYFGGTNHFSNEIYGIAIVDRDIYVADKGNKRISHWIAPT